MSITTKPCALPQAPGRSLRTICYKEASRQERLAELAHIIFCTPYVERYKQRRASSAARGKRRRKGTAGGFEDAESPWHACWVTLPFLGALQSSCIFAASSIIMYVLPGVDDEELPEDAAQPAMPGADNSASEVPSPLHANFTS
jgi:hypothetical protein